MTAPDLERFRVPRPRRADGARNFEAIVAAAREAFLERGTDASLDDVASRAGVGIATLYRSFANRDLLVQHLYVTELQTMLREADSEEEAPPWDRFATWTTRFVRYLGTSRSLATALDPGSEVYGACREAILSAALPLVEAVRAAGELRLDVSGDDLSQFVYGVGVAHFGSEQQRRKMVEVLLDGLRARS
jgi:AcrR family transcriptional regulator